MELSGLLERFASLLEYPDEDFSRRCEVLRADLEQRGNEGVEAARDFELAVADLPPERLREIYAATFDLNPACCLYAGYHLFGDSYKRGALMAKLNAEYRAHGFDAGNELPDHLSVLFRFLSRLDDEELRDDLLQELALPALDRIVKSFVGTDNIYASLARAALAGLSGGDSAVPRRLAFSLPVLEPDGSLSRG